MALTLTHEQTRILVQAAAAACEDKKAEDTRILELDPIDSGLSDFFLVTSATNDRQAVAIADEVELRLKRQFGVMPNAVEGRRPAEFDAELTAALAEKTRTARKRHPVAGDATPAKKAAKKAAAKRPAAKAPVKKAAKKSAAKKTSRKS
jgi:ribosome-associated protein